MYGSVALEHHASKWQKENIFLIIQVEKNIKLE